MIKRFFKLTMSEFSPQILLSNETRERCVANLKDLPSFYFHKSTKIKQTASVLVPLCIVDSEVSLLYTLRSSNLKSHSGQVSFPGGKTDKGESFVETALRETQEELGIPKESVDVWCQMSPVQGRNRDLLITPVVGYLIDFDTTKLEPNIHEVEEVFTVPIRTLCDKNSHGYFTYERNILPVYIFEKHKIWGITAMITHLFLQNYLAAHLYDVDFTRKKYEMNQLMPSDSKL